MFLLDAERCSIGEGVVAHCFIERPYMIATYRNILHFSNNIYPRDYSIIDIFLPLNPSERLMLQHFLPALFCVLKRAVPGLGLDAVVVEIRSKKMVFIHIYPFIVEIRLSWMFNLKAKVYVVILDSFAIYIRLHNIHQLLFLFSHCLLHFR